MGRVYDIQPDKSKGELRGYKHAVFTVDRDGANGQKIAFVQRVEFQDDADEGMAVVTSIMVDSLGAILQGSFSPGVGIVNVTFPAYVRIVEITPTKGMADEGFVDPFVR